MWKFHQVGCVITVVLFAVWILLRKIRLFFWRPVCFEKARLSEMANLGVKSVMFAGEGEPLLHKDMAEITVHAKKTGIDTAFTTNATCLTEKFCNKAIGSIEWIKVSINAGTPKTYAKIHNAPEKPL